MNYTIFYHKVGLHLENKFPNLGNPTKWKPEEVEHFWAEFDLTMEWLFKNNKTVKERYGETYKMSKLDKVTSSSFKRFFDPKQENYTGELFANSIAVFLGFISAIDFMDQNPGDTNNFKKNYLFERPGFQNPDYAIKEEINPKIEKIEGDVGKLNREIEGINETIDDLTERLKKNVDFIEIIEELDKGNSKKAIRLLEQLNLFNQFEEGDLSKENFENGILLLAKLKTITEHYNSAIGILVKASALLPESLQIILLLVELYSLKGEIDVMIKDLIHFCETNTDNYKKCRVQFELLEIYTNRKDTDNINKTNGKIETYISFFTNENDHVSLAKIYYHLAIAAYERNDYIDAYERYLSCIQHLESLNYLEGEILLRANFSYHLFQAELFIDSGEISNAEDQLSSIDNMFGIEFIDMLQDLYIRKQALQILIYRYKNQQEEAELEKNRLGEFMKSISNKTARPQKLYYLLFCRIKEIRGQTIKTKYQYSRIFGKEFEPELVYDFLSELEKTHWAEAKIKLHLAESLVQNEDFKEAKKYYSQTLNLLQIVKKETSILVDIEEFACICGLIFSTGRTNPNDSNIQILVKNVYDFLNENERETWQVIKLIDSFELLIQSSFFGTRARDYLQMVDLTSQKIHLIKDTKSELYIFLAMRNAYFRLNGFLKFAVVSPNEKLRVIIKEMIPETESLINSYKKIFGEDRLINQSNQFIAYFKRYSFESISLNQSLLKASERNIFDLSFELCQLNTDINIQNSDGCAPLHYSVRNNNVEMTQLFLEKGADKQIKNEKGETPIDIAMIENNTEILQLFKS